MFSAILAGTFTAFALALIYFALKHAFAPLVHLEETDLHND